jgi:hypothetical protein
LCGGFISQSAREKADNGIEHEHGGEFAAAQNIIPDRDFLGGEVFGDALVDSFVTATNEDNAVQSSVAARGSLTEEFSRGGHENDGGFWIRRSLVAGIPDTASEKRFDGVEKGLGLQHHAFAAAKRAIIDGAVAVLGKYAKVLYLDADDAGLARATKDSMVEWASKKFRKNRDKVEAHRPQSNECALGLSHAADLGRVSQWKMRRATNLAARVQLQPFSATSPFRLIEIEQPVGENDVNTVRGRVDACADVFGKGNEQFAVSGVHLKERRAGKTPSGELHVANDSKEGRSPGERAWRRGNNGRSGGVSEDGAADQIGDEMLASRKRDTLLEGKQDIETAEFLSIGNRVASFEMKDGLAVMILAEPAGFHSRASGFDLAGSIAEIDFRQFSEALRKVGEQLGGNFTFPPARPKNVRNQDPAWGFAAQW